MSRERKQPRYWRYEVTEVWGEMEGRIEVGSICVDRWKNPPEWHTINFKTGKDGGWSAKRLGEVTKPESLAQIAANREKRIEELARESR